MRSSYCLCAYTPAINFLVSEQVFQKLSMYGIWAHQVKVTLRLTVSQPVSLGVEPHDQIFITLWQFRSCFCVAPSLMRGRVCLLFMLLVLASAVFLGSESLGTRDHILLSQIWDFPVGRLLRLAGSRWRYSTPPTDVWTGDWIFLTLCFWAHLNGVLLKYLPPVSVSVSVPNIAKQQLGKKTLPCND
jgi:hypothetical protein